MGESSARPSVRMPPLQINEVHRLFQGIRSRHGRYNLNTTKALRPYDIYISLSGGRELGASYQRWFQNTGPPTTTTRCMHVFLDPVSVQNRCERARGIASNRSHDVMRLTAAPWPRVELKTTPRIHYKGSSASDSIGPVALHQMEDEEAWTLTWAQKKQLYGKLGLMAVGGRGDVVDDGPDDADETIDEAGASSLIPSRRTDDTKELAFFHALPSTFWDEVVHDYQLGAILDIAVGDGSLALTAVRNRITYTGFAFTDYHKEMVMARLLDLLSAGALKAGDKWYDPNPAKTLTSASKTKNKRQDCDTEDGPPRRNKQR